MKKSNENQLINGKERKKEKLENTLVFTLCFVLFAPSLNNYLNCFLQTGLKYEVKYISEAVYIALAGLGVVQAFRCFYKDMKVLTIALFLILGGACSFFIYPEIRDVIYEDPVDLIYNPLNKLVFFCVPALIYSSFISDFEKLFGAMVKWARVTVITGVFTYVFVAIVKERDLQYMVFSYFLLTSICICIENFRGTKNKVDLVLAVIGTFSILFCGARGAVLSLLSYIILRSMIGDANDLSLKKTTRVTVVAMLMLIFFLFWEPILEWFLEIGEKMGISSRFLTAIEEGTLLESSGRDKISHATWKAIKSNPLGYGIFGDRYATGAYGNGKYTYSHNILLESICSFGLIFGTMFIVVFFKRIVRAIRQEKKFYNMTIWSLIPYGIFQLFFSSSMFENVTFYILFALIFTNKTGRVDGRNEKVS